MAMLHLAILAAIVYVIYNIFSHGFIMSWIFFLLHGVFYANPRLAKFFGIKTVLSSEYSTNREDSRLHLPRFFPQAMGLNWTFGNRDQVNHLKMRQRKSTRPIDLAPYFIDFVGKRMSVTELESTLVDAWISELLDVYDIPITDRVGFGQRIRVIRQFNPTFLDSPIRGFIYLFRNFRSFINIRNDWKNLDSSEVAMMLVPFLTTIDSSIFNFVTNPNPIKEFHELFDNVPVAYLPINNRGELLLLKIVANKANNPGNTVFGAQGLICPGNVITSHLMKSVAQLKEQYSTNIEGKAQQKDGLIRYVTNPDEVFVTFNLRDESYVVPFNSPLDVPLLDRD
jgi:hypothetical protein